MLYSNRKRIMIVCITIYIVVTMLIGMGMVSADVLAIGKRTIKHMETTIGTDLHFVVYQGMPSTSCILGWEIELSVSYSTIKAVPDDWPYDDGNIHSVAVDIDGIHIPKNRKVDIIATLILNSSNTVEFKDIEWSYSSRDNEEAMSADICLVRPAAPGTSTGGWVIAKYTVKDENDNLLCMDMAAYEYLSSESYPDLSTIIIYNGAPYDYSNTIVYIYDWGIADLGNQVLPAWDVIENWDDWDVYAEGPIIINPGCTKNSSGQPFPTFFPTPTPTPSPPPTPTPTP